MDSPLARSLHEEDIEEILFDEAAVQERVSQLAAEINRDYQGKKIVLLGILKGSVVFLTDLAKKLQVEARLEFLTVSSYGSGTTSSGTVQLIQDTRSSIEGEHVLIVEDILDSGVTLKYLTELLQARNPASLNICVLLRKSARLRVRLEDLPVKYTGWEIPDKWVIGYGMDYDEKYRTLPFIGVLKKSVYEKTLEGH